MCFSYVQYDEKFRTRNPKFCAMQLFPCCSAPKAGAGLLLDCRSVRLESVTIDAYLPADCKEAR